LTDEGQGDPVVALSKSLAAAGVLPACFAGLEHRAATELNHL